MSISLNLELRCLSGKMLLREREMKGWELLCYYQVTQEAQENRVFEMHK